MRCYRITAEDCWVGITSAEGWVRYAWALENEISAFGAVYERVGDGYVAAERKRILESWQKAI